MGYRYILLCLVSVVLVACNQSNTGPQEGWVHGRKFVRGADGVYAPAEQLTHLPGGALSGLNGHLELGSPMDGASRSCSNYEVVVRQCASVVRGMSDATKASRVQAICMRNHLPPDEISLCSAQQ